MNTKMNVAEFVTVALATENPEGVTLRDIRRKLRGDFNIRLGYVDIRAMLDGSSHVTPEGDGYKLPGATKAKPKEVAPEVAAPKRRGRKPKAVAECAPLAPVGPFLPDMKSGAVYL